MFCGIFLTFIKHKHVFISEKIISLRLNQTKRTR